MSTGSPPRPLPETETSHLARASGHGSNIERWEGAPVLTALDPHTLHDFREEGEESHDVRSSTPLDYSPDLDPQKSETSGNVH